MNNRLATVGLVGLLAVDVALVAFALRPQPVEDPVLPLTTATSVPTPTGTTVRPSSGTSSTRPPSGSPTSAAVRPVGLLVSALDTTTAWRARVGSCTAGGATLEVTTDGGKSWTKTKSPARAVSRVQPLDEERAFVIGAGEDCRLRQFATTNQGSAWQPGTTPQGGWARGLDDPTSVLTPKDTGAAPCGTDTVLDLSRVSATQAEALCADGAVRATDDGGSSWSDSGTAPGAVALGNYLAGEVLTTYAVRPAAGCAGLQLVRVVRDKPADPVTCVKLGQTRPGLVGLSVSAAGGWIVSGPDTWRALGSSLRSWEKSEPA